MEKSEEPVTLNPELLGLQRVGEERKRSPPKYPINKRGTPARTLKRNKFFYDVNYVSGSDLYRSPKKGLSEVCIDQSFDLLNENKKKESEYIKTLHPSFNKSSSLMKKNKANYCLNYNKKALRNQGKNVESESLSSNLENSGFNNLPHSSPETALSLYNENNSEKCNNNEDNLKLAVKKCLRIRLKPITKCLLEISPLKKAGLKKKSRNTTRSSHLDLSVKFSKIGLSGKKLMVHRKLNFDSEIDLNSLVERNGQRLRNLLKLPKAHKWVCFEWFYSHLDRVLFLNENDFQIYLLQKFPNLKTRMLTRIEWCNIRRLMGKPRRCSEAFYSQECNALEVKRMKIRTLQLRKPIDDILNYELPEEVPSLLCIGTRVTARLRHPRDGLLSGRIDAVDTITNSYRITFDHPSLGTQSVCDFEVAADEIVENLPLSSFMYDLNKGCIPLTQTISSPTRIQINKLTPMKNDPLLGGSPVHSKLLSMDGILGRYSVAFLVRFTKLLKTKKQKIQELKQMNAEAEKLQSFQDILPVEFRCRYATIVLDLDKLNRKLRDIIKEIEDGLIKIEPNECSLDLEILQDKCKSEAEQMIEILGGCRSHYKLILELVVLLLQIKKLTNSCDHVFELEAVTESIEKIKSIIHTSNLNTFRDYVEVHMTHIQKSLWMQMLFTGISKL